MSYEQKEPPNNKLCRKHDADSCMKKLKIDDKKLFQEELAKKEGGSLGLKVNE